MRLPHPRGPDPDGAPGAAATYGVLAGNEQAGVDPLAALTFGGIAGGQISGMNPLAQQQFQQTVGGQYAGGDPTAAARLGVIASGQQAGGNPLGLGTLEATARAVAAALAAEPLLFGAGARIAIERSDLPPLYLAGLVAAPLLDGYDEEWSDIAPHLLEHLIVKPAGRWAIQPVYLVAAGLALGIIALSGPTWATSA